MLFFPVPASRDPCGGVTRRDMLRVGGLGLLGLSLSNILRLESRATESAEKPGGGPGFGKAKSVILIYLQGGPSHLDLWDPKDNVPANVQSIFKQIPTK